MEFQVIEGKTVVANKTINVSDEEGIIKDIARLYGSVDLNGSINYSFTVVNEKLYAGNREAIQQIVDTFVADLQEEAKKLKALTF